MKNINKVIAGEGGEMVSDAEAEAAQQLSVCVIRL